MTNKKSVGGCHPEEQKEGCLWKQEVGFIYLTVPELDVKSKLKL